jgi:hypothetical protein
VCCCALRACFFPDLQRESHKGMRCASHGWMEVGDLVGWQAVLRVLHFADTCQMVL